MEIAALILSAAAVVLLIILLARKPERQDPREYTDPIRKELAGQLSAERKSQAESVQAMNDSNLRAMDQLSRMLQSGQNQAARLQSQQISSLEQKLVQREDQLQKNVDRQLGSMDQRLRAMDASVEERLDAMRRNQTESMTAMRAENTKKLEEIRLTVDEKLQSTLEKHITESFRMVSEQLEAVYKGLGEMQTLASDVGGLKKVLSGVKTRGILGEIQLGAILEEILSPEQYETNVATIPGSSERVEFAVKLPAKDGTVWLPIDSKFPGDRYAQLLEAQENGDRTAVEAAYKALETVIRAEAKDIRTKYVEVPYTTNFGVLFLPFEGLYAEVVNRGLIEVLQREYQINIAGPSTMAALLNSLQMGFRTLAIQKRADEVWQVLASVRTEFDKFGDSMIKMQKHLNQTSSELENLMGTRTRAIQRKLGDIQRLEAGGTDSFPELTGGE